MAAASTLSSVAYIYKTTYSSNVGIVAVRKHPLLAMMTKTGGFTGNNFTYPMRYGNPQGVGGTFIGAQAGVSPSKGVQFAALRFKKYGDITLDGEALQACDSKGSFLDLVTLETDAIITEHIDRLAFDLYRDGTCQRGQIASLATNVMTLIDPDTARNFKINMVVQASPNANGSSPRTGTTTVAGVSIAGGTVTLTNAAAITLLGANDYFFAATEIGTGVQGLEASTPLVAPIGGDNFRGIDRSVFPELLSGSRVADTTTPIEENAGLAAIYVNANGGTSDSLMLNPIRFWQVVRRLGAKVEYEGMGGEVTFGFESIKISTPAGTLKCYSDPDAPTNRGRGFDSGSHYYRTLLDQVHIIMDDGRPNLRSTSDDSIEARTRSMGNYIQTDTRNHFVFQI